MQTFHAIIDPLLCVATIGVLLAGFFCVLTWRGRA